MQATALHNKNSSKITSSSLQCTMCTAMHFRHCNAIHTLQCILYTIVYSGIYSVYLITVMTRDHCSGYHVTAMISWSLQWACVPTAVIQHVHFNTESWHSNVYWSLCNSRYNANSMKPMSCNDWSRPLQWRRLCTEIQNDRTLFSRQHCGTWPPVRQKLLSTKLLRIHIGPSKYTLGISKTMEFRGYTAKYSSSVQF